MKVYLTYKFKEEDLGPLRAMLEKFSRLIEDATGWKTFIFFRDVQKWQKPAMSVNEVIERALKEVENCDAILAEASEKARGVYFEVGYAKAKKKKVIVIHKKGTEANFLEALADVKIEYDDWDDLREKLREVKLS